MPRRTVLFLVALFALVLTACQARSPVTTTPAEPTTPTEAPTRTAALPTKTIPPAQPTGATSLEVAKCTAVSPMPTAGPTEQSLFKPVGEQDWRRGPDDAAVTIVEYSDFQ